MQEKLITVKSLKDLVDDVSDMFNGKDIKKEEISDLKRKILSVVCSHDRKEIMNSYDEIYEILGHPAYCMIDLWPGFFNKKHAMLARVFIGMDEYIDYLAYVGTVPAYFLNKVSLYYMRQANNEDMPL